MDFFGPISFKEYQEWVERGAERFQEALRIVFFSGSSGSFGGINGDLFGDSGG